MADLTISPIPQQTDDGWTLSARLAVLGATTFPVNVKWAPYGAKGDGTTDDTTAIQAAIDAAQAVGGSNYLYIPAGTYRVSNLTIKRGLTIVGASKWNTILSGKAGATGWMLTIDGNAVGAQLDPETNQVPIGISNLTLDGNGRQANYGAVWMQYVDYLNVSSVQIWRFSRSALMFYASVRESLFSDVSVRYCGNKDATDNPAGAGWPAVSLVDWESSLGSAEDVHNGLTFYRLHVVFSLGDSIVVDTRQIHSGRKVTNLKFAHCWVHGWNSGFSGVDYFATINASGTMQAFALMDLRACYDVTVTHSRFSFTGKGRPAILLSRSTLGGSAVAGRTYDPEQVIIEGNFFNGSWDAATSGRFAIQGDYGSGLVANNQSDASIQAPQFNRGTSFRELSAVALSDFGLSFDGLSGTKIVGACQSLTTSDFTVHLRVRMPQTAPATNNAGLWFLGSVSGSASTPGIGAYLSTNGNLYLLTYGATGSDTRTAAISTDWLLSSYGQIVDLTFTRAAGVMRIYLNGGELPYVESTAGSAPAWSQSITTTFFNVGTFISSNPWVSSIHAARVFNRALSAADVQSLALAGVHPSDRWGATTVLSSGNLVVGARYRIVARATSDFTTAGASANSVGTEWVATTTGAGLLTASDTVQRIGAVIDLDVANARGAYVPDNSTNLLPGTISGGAASSRGSGGLLYGSTTWDPPSLVTGASATTTVTVTGARVGDLVTLSLSTLTTQAMILTGTVSANDTITATLANVSGGTIDITSGTLRASVEKRT